MGLRLPGIVLAHEIAERLVCAVRLTEDCRNEPLLRAANGAEVAALLRDHAPALLYEDGMTALPVDFRECRSDSCAEGARSGAVTRTRDGFRVVAFTHVIDCRSGHVGATEAWGGNCSGARTGNLYLQYWLYYPGSATAEGSTPLKGPIRRLSHGARAFDVPPGRLGGLAGADRAPAEPSSRATSHHGYNGWEPDGDRYYISGGSHAGRPLRTVHAVLDPRSASRRRAQEHRRIGRLVLVPLETLPDRDRYAFAISPPWRKRVWFDPGVRGND